MTSSDRSTIGVTVTAMAMDFTVTVATDAHHRDATQGALDTLAGYLASDLEWVDAVFSTYREDSWISRLNRGEVRVSDAPAAVAEVLDLCERFRDETDGWFDARTPDGGVDPTGIVKTWAMDRVRWRLALLGVECGMFACAGDIEVFGAVPAGSPWRIGIADPRVPSTGKGASVDSVSMGGRGRPRALATSGLAHDANHIWAPVAKGNSRTPSTVMQASVVGPDLVQCDAWATAIVAGGDQVARLAPRFGMQALALRRSGGRVKSLSTPHWPSDHG
ncbi:FAD:protein FMN transferase [Demequina sp. B12]|uniref:FAD:protein FMN transferase n=1 Tax=Demequina sp. B12 TaxID=2992757 RepID=UPI00237ABB4F|nr:FAD:protein FMN transferase [Demequina sp. B12]MDE0573426.1 FAD:protein FMN transferase [Demequina sp. B12]